MLSRSKLNSGPKKSDISEIEYLENLSKSSKSKGSKDYSQAKQIMQKNLSNGDTSGPKINYKDIISKQYSK